eukprot:6033281-Lingulodinium_polyedra.AAC.1
MAPRAKRASVSRIARLRAPRAHQFSGAHGARARPICKPLRRRTIDSAASLHNVLKMPRNDA